MKYLMGERETIRLGRAFSRRLALGKSRASHIVTAITPSLTPPLGY
jgi:hypothetical protein